MANVVKVSIDSEILDIDCTRVAKFADLRQRVADLGFATTVDNYFVQTSEDGEEKEFGDDDPVEIPNNPEPPMFDMRTRKTEVSVKHGNADPIVLTVPASSTIGDIRQLAESHGRIVVPRLTLEGSLLSDEKKLTELKISDSDVLRGAVPVKVVDDHCALEVFVEVYESDTVRTLLEAYRKKTRRVASEFTVETNRSDPVQLDDTLHSLQLGDEPVLKVQAAPYQVLIQIRKSQARPLEVRDDLTVRQLKEMLVERDFDVIQSTDTPLYDNEPMVDDLMLYKYFIRPGTTITIAVEDVPIFKYSCADCGAEVKLKRTDFVRCRDCGYRIVYKLRTTEPSQFAAR